MSLQTHGIGDQNVERLLCEAYRPESMDPGFVQETQDMLLAAVQNLGHARQQQRLTASTPPRRDYKKLRRCLGWSMAAAAALTCVYLVQYASRRQATALPVKERDTLAAHRDIIDKLIPSRASVGLSPKPRAAPPRSMGFKLGESLTTRAGEKRRLTLEDGSILYVNEGTEIKHSRSRHIELSRGEVYVEVAPRESGSGATFTVETPDRKVSALGTRFAVQADPKGSGVLVTQGKVQISDLDRPLTTGEQLITGSTRVGPAPRATHELDWTKELMAAAETPLVPGAQHCGGALLAIDPFGQEVRLTLRKFHIDVHIEDGFARTTIDQTYFNNETWRLEGTFYFPLPPDASLSRLAMYVDQGDSCVLNEGGMAERNHAREVYETILHQRRDPALLEWVDGSTFKMRVFPLEGRREKRIILSYTQRLPSMYGITHYRFPTGHTMELVRDWSFEAHVKHGADLRITSPSHPDDMKIVPKGGDMVLTTSAKNTRPEKDVVLEILDGADNRELARFSRSAHENSEYLMLRYRPDLKTEGKIERRDWVILFEAAANRDPLLARTQIEVIRHLLENAEHDDTFTLLSANTRVHFFDKAARPLTRKNVEEALAWLDTSHLIGALDLNQAFEAVAPILKGSRNPHLVHIGAGVPALGERRDEELAKRVPEGTRYVGIGVGKKWNRTLMKLAAERTGGYFTQINPDESTMWRTFDLLATLNTPRLLNLQVKDAAGKALFLTESLALTQGEEVCAITRLDASKKEPLPAKVIVSGTLDGKSFTRELSVEKAVPGAGYLPRTWAKMEIDRLLAEGSEKNKEAITRLSMAMYVMSPFTSLLVLETEDDYKNFKVDRGRKDHWAQYPCPDRIPAVFEPDPARQAWALPRAPEGLKPREHVLSTILIRPAPRFLRLPGHDDGQELPAYLNAYQLYAGVLALGQVNDLVFGEWERLSDDTHAIRLGDLGLRLDKELSDQNLHLERSFRESRTSSVFGRFPRDRKGWLGESLLEDLATKKKPGAWDLTPRRKRQSARSLTLYRDLSRLAEEENAIRGLDLGEKEMRPELLSARLRWGEFPVLRPEPPLEEMTRLLIPPGQKELSSVMRRQWVLRNEFFLRQGKKSLEDGRPVSAFDFDGLFLQDETFDQGKARRRLFADLRSSRLRSSSPGQHLIFSPPRFQEDYRLFGDLTLYAPGLQPRLEDIERTLELEAKPEKPVLLGTVDEGARKLIDSARSASWETVTVYPNHGLPFQVTLNGLGHFQYDRVLPNGLRETVIADAECLWHLYPEIGLAARRNNGRPYFHEIGDLVPWLLPPVEDLARWSDVKLVDENVVALVPRMPSKDTEKEEWAKDEKTYLLQLVFSEGRLAQRQLVEMPSARVVMRETYESDGTVKTFNGGEIVTSERKHGRTSGVVPNLTPDTRDLLVMRFPVRTVHYLNELPGMQRAIYPKMAKSLAEDLLIAHCWENRGWNALELFAERFHAQGDHRLGFYVLLNSARIPVPSARPYHVRDGLVVTFDLLKEHAGHPVAQYLDYNQRILAGNTPLHYLGTLPGERHGFLNRLACCRDTVAMWQGNRLGDVGTEEFQINCQRTVRELEDATEPVWAWAIVEAVTRNGRSNNAFQLALGKVQKELGEDLGLLYSGRYQYASRMYAGGNPKDARRHFLVLYEDTFRNGILPPIDATFRSALNHEAPEGSAPFAKFMRERHARLLKEQRPLLALELTWQTYQVGERALAGEFFLSTINSVKGEHRNLLRLAGLEFLWHTSQFAYADTVLQKVLDDPELGELPEIWRAAAHFAERRGMLARAVAATEKAMDLEYRDLPEIINLEVVRQDYRGLLDKYQQMATAFSLAETEAPRELIAKVIKTADRWRSLDPENLDIPERAANILQRVGARELAWDYLTTPIGMKPAEAAPWIQLAENLRDQAEFELADRAYHAAFTMEPTNAQILWDRAQNLLTMSRMDEARAVFGQIASGTWQPRFRWIQDQAKAMR